MEKKEKPREQMVFDGTALYEIDLDCVERKKQEKKDLERQRQNKGAH